MAQLFGGFLLLCSFGQTAPIHADYSFTLGGVVCNCRSLGDCRGIIKTAKARVVSIPPEDREAYLQAVKPSEAKLAELEESCAANGTR